MPLDLPLPPWRRDSATDTTLMYHGSFSVFHPWPTAKPFSARFANAMRPVHQALRKAAMNHHTPRSAPALMEDLPGPNRLLTFERIMTREWRDTGRARTRRCALRTQDRLEMRGSALRASRLYVGRNARGDGGHWDSDCNAHAGQSRGPGNRPGRRRARTTCGSLAWRCTTERAG